MRTVVSVAFCVLLITGCKTTAGEVADLKAQVDDLSHRVKSLEDDRLKAEKQLIQQRQAMQLMHEQIRNIENYFDKMQAGQTAH